MPTHDGHGREYASWGGDDVKAAVGARQQPRVAGGVFCGVPGRGLRPAAHGVGLAAKADHAGQHQFRRGGEHASERVSWRVEAFIQRRDFPPTEYDRILARMAIEDRSSGCGDGDATV